MAGQQPGLLLDQRLADMDGKLTTVNGKLTTLEGKLTTMEGAITAMQHQLVQIGNQLTAMNGQLAGAGLNPLHLAQIDVRTKNLFKGSNELLLPMPLPAGAQLPPNMPTTAHEAHVLSGNSACQILLAFGQQNIPAQAAACRAQLCDFLGIR